MRVDTTRESLIVSLAAMDSIIRTMLSHLCPAVILFIS
ncbi:hypothetical protein HMPREF9294_0677 [Porphyromonas asaccharolytica PR426713P-I]|nr:hypothetical protein HMPREF9294_0677 [Porphyromonas asaccharolytica PR426713P-I]